MSYKYRGLHIEWLAPISETVCIFQDICWPKHKNRCLMEPVNSNVYITPKWMKLILCDRNRWTIFQKNSRFNKIDMICIFQMLEYKSWSYQQWKFKGFIVLCLILIFVASQFSTTSVYLRDQLQIMILFTMTWKVWRLSKPHIGCVVVLWHNESVNANPGLTFLCGAQAH